MRSGGCPGLRCRGLRIAQLRGPAACCPGGRLRRPAPTPCWPGWSAWNCRAGSPRRAGPTGRRCPCRPPPCAAAGRPCRRPLPSCSGTPRTWCCPRDGRGTDGRGRRRPAPGERPSPPPSGGRDAADPGRSGRAQLPVRGAAGRSLGPGRDRPGAGGRGGGGGSVRRALFPYQSDSYTTGSNAIVAVGEGARGARPRPDGAGASRQRSPGEPPGVRVRGGPEHPAPADRPDRPGVRAAVGPVRPASGHACATPSEDEVALAPGEAGAASWPARRLRRGRATGRRRPGRDPRIDGRAGPGVPAAPAGPDRRPGNPDRGGRCLTGRVAAAGRGRRPEQRGDRGPPAGGAAATAPGW